MRRAGDQDNLRSYYVGRKGMKSVTQDVSRSRRNFLRGNITGKANTIRPPWAIADSLFRERCTRCDDCIEVCPEKIILRTDDGYPQIEFSNAGCTFCAECLEACNTRALEGMRSDTDQAWRHSMQITDNCLSVKGVVCRTCGDHCEVRAIKFTLLTRGRSLPEIESASCTGCGQCIPVCPADAITIFDNLEVA
jgi:ferredoxin-type protein NapF